jgi:hypothetical protein
MIGTKREVSWANEGDESTVCDCPFAKLKYYLGCVYEMLEGDEQRKIPVRFRTDYTKGCGLKTTDKDELIRLARLYHPDIMVKRGLFRLDDENRFCNERANEFTTITSKQTTADASGRSAAETTYLVKVMNFTTDWVSDSFYEACQEAEEELLAKRLEELPADQKSVAKGVAFENSDIEHLLALLSIPKEVVA